MTKTFRNVSPLGDLELPAVGQVVPAGGTVTVPDELAESLAAQPANWKPVDEDKKKGEGE